MNREIDTSEWRKRIEAERENKDNFFGSGHPQSPIRGLALSNFNGLKYYRPDPSYLFELELHEHSENYACPYVPPENWLEIAVEAGEKNYEH
ncbi:DUF1684 domain-containing protein [bacterium]|nr:DUF1684 domain-containing protein [bacterium]